MSHRPLRMRRLGLEHVRNLEAMVFEPSPQFTILFGQNGQGKTSLLEAVYLACRGQSFRTAQMGEIPRHGELRAELRAELEDDGISRAQRVVLARQGKTQQRRLEIEGKRARSMAAFAVQTPVVVFHPGELTLTMSGALSRRQLLDRVAFFRNPSHLQRLGDYTKAQRERQRALTERGPSASDLPEWELLVAEHGLALCAERRAAAALLEEQTQHAFVALAAPGLRLSMRYLQSAPETAEEYRVALSQSRVRDSHRGSASIGPHRDEWELCLDERAARSFASQGQHRALTLAIKSAEIEVIARARGVQPIVLLDDVSSELDSDRTSALYRFLRQQRGQVLLTTTRPELVSLEPDPSSEVVFYELRGGRLERSVND